MIFLDFSPQCSILNRKLLGESNYESRVQSSNLTNDMQIKSIDLMIQKKRCTMKKEESNDKGLNLKLSNTFCLNILYLTTVNHL